MRVWRVCRRPYVAIDGAGARRFGGRWNLRGTPIVYTSGTAALAVLEYFVNLEVEDAPPDLVLVWADVPSALRVEAVAVRDLPRAWRTTPAPEELARLGTSWATAKRTPVLAVPSAVLPVERNYLLDPAHPSFARVAVGRPEPLTLDPRLWKGAKR